MSNIQHHKLKVARTAQIFTYGNKDTAKVAVLVCHGYAHLADRIIQKFSNIPKEDIYVVSPEGLSVFYWKGMKQDPVASWMTSRNRLDEISDFSHYLTQVYNGYLSDFKGKIVLMGFSQGCATIWRWQHRASVAYHSMINWAGWIPEDIDLSDTMSHLENPIVHIAIGDQDQYLSDDRVAAMKEVVNRNNIPATYHTFEGKHQVDRTLLESIILSIQVQEEVSSLNSK